MKRPPAALGRREQSKLDRRERIRTAAAALFARHGFDAATMRQIAHRAHVGLGTLFNYAEDKRDLVFLIFNEELDAITDEALAAAHPDVPLIDQLLAICGCHYRHFGAQPALARILLRELTFYSHGKQASEFVKTRQRLIDGFERLARHAQRDGRIRTTENPELIARHLFFVYSAAIRWWIAAPRPDPKKGIADLRRLLTLQIDGLQPAAAGKRRVSRSSRPSA